MRRCLEPPKPSGLLLVQTPCFRNGASYESLVESKDPFLGMSIPEEHIISSARVPSPSSSGRPGAEHIAFEPAIFHQHDMFLRG